MENDAKVTHEENRMQKDSGTEQIFHYSPESENNAASVNGKLAAKEALRSMEMNTTDKSKPSELTTGD